MTRGKGILILALAAAQWPDGVSLAQAQGELWQARSVTTRSITGDVTFSPTRITFETGQALDLTSAGALPGFVAYGRQVNASLYRVRQPKDLELVRGNRLCDGKPVTFVIVWRPAYVGDDPTTRGIGFFTGNEPPITDRGPSTCGTFTYDSQRLR